MKKFAVPNKNIYVGSGLCTKACPAGCISIKERSEVK